MKKWILYTLIFSACTIQKKDGQQQFPVLDIVDDNEWATYEGKWLTVDGVVHFELALKTGSPGYDADFTLRESYDSERLGSGTTSKGQYSSYTMENNEFGICVHNVNSYDKGSYLRYRKSVNMNEQDEMYFLTRGNNELIPCDDNYSPLTTDTRYTLHKRSALFTVEGYFTVVQDSIDFFERNTSENWKLADLGEFNELKFAYNNLAKEKFEGIYLKALAYSVRGSSMNKDALVIKRIKSLGNDPGD